jgi:hypothetical protein
VAEQHDRPSGPRLDRADYRSDVSELTLGGVAGTVRAGTEATAVHAEDGRLAS